MIGQVRPGVYDLLWLFCLRPIISTVPILFHQFSSACFNFAPKNSVMCNSLNSTKKSMPCLQELPVPICSTLAWSGPFCSIQKHLWVYVWVGLYWGGGVKPEVSVTGSLSLTQTPFAFDPSLGTAPLCGEPHRAGSTDPQFISENQTQDAESGGRTSAVLVFKRKNTDTPSPGGGGMQVA